MTDNEIKLMELDKTVRENEIVRQINEKRRIDLEQQRITEFDKIVDDSINEIAERVIGDPAIVDRIDNEISKISVLAKSAVVFDTVEEMKQSDKLKAGMTARTNGFHKVGDGGAAWYRIESSGIHNDMDVILCNNRMYAKLIVAEKKNVKQYGAYGNGTDDDTDVLNYIASSINSGDVVLFPNGNYKVVPTANKQDFFKVNATCIIDGCDSTITVGTNGYPYYNVFNIQSSGVVCKNINVVGDALTHNYGAIASTHEFGYAWFIQGSGLFENCTATFITGDGFVIKNSTASNGTGGTVTIKNCDIEYCRRNGISILDSDKVEIIDTKSVNIGNSDKLTGTAPNSGIDIEPDTGAFKVNSVIIKGCEFQGATSAIVTVPDSGRYSIGYIDIEGTVFNGITCIALGNSVPFAKKHAFMRNCEVNIKPQNGTTVAIATMLGTNSKSEGNMCVENCTITNSLDYYTGEKEDYFCELNNCILNGVNSLFNLGVNNSVLDGCSFMGAAPRQAGRFVGCIITDCKLKNYASAPAKFFLCDVKELTFFSDAKGSSNPNQKFYNCIIENSETATANADKQNCTVVA